jgi:two-component system, sensor histidine kinase
LDLSDTQIRALLDSAPDSTVISDESGTIVFANAQAESMFGYARQELIGMPVEALMPERFRQRHPAHRDSYVREPRLRPMGVDAGINLDLYARHRDGSEFPVEISLSPFRSGTGLLISTSIRDVTERKLILEQLRAARTEADKANRAKSTFLATASHDLRQPLQTLMLLNSVLQKTSTDPLALTAVATQHEALSSMSELVNALLDISKLESGAIRPDITDCSVQAIFRHLRASFEELARSKGLAFVVDDCDDVVHTDRGLLEQIIQNLVANAIRYTREGMVRLRCLHENAFVRIEVMDTGIGIPLDQQDAIFDEFYQLGRAAGDKREGLGLGLAIVRRMARLLGHDIELTSAPGRGSCFAVTVPRGESAVVIKPALKAPQSARASSGLIMLVDDDPAVSGATKMLLKVEGYEVLAAASLEETLVLLNDCQRVPDLIVSDFHLQASVSGIDVIGRVREVTGRSIPALLVTGDTSSYLVDEVERSGGCEVLSKPVVPTEFLERVSQLLMTRRSASN